MSGNGLNSKLINLELPTKSVTLIEILANFVVSVTLTLKDAALSKFRIGAPPLS
jgi:hypothetical protein